PSESEIPDPRARTRRSDPVPEKRSRIASRRAALVRDSSAQSCHLEQDPKLASAAHGHLPDCVRSTQDSQDFCGAPPNRDRFGLLRDTRVLPRHLVLTAQERFLESSEYARLTSAPVLLQSEYRALG